MFEKKTHPPDGPLHTVKAETVIQLLRQRTHHFEWIDVRSESEFQKASIPFFDNLPILNNQERHLVGLEYKKVGKSSAVRLGEELTLPKKDGKIRYWSQEILDSPQKTGFVMCWRGGLRSKIATEWINSNGVEAYRIQGGYKSLRRALLESLNNPPDFLVLSGLTGSRKTELIRELNVSKLDLEKIANHRGSAFGAHRNGQPTQASFENHLALEFLHLESCLVEDESRLIGKLILPEKTKTKMRNSPTIVIESSMDERAEHIFQEYILSPLKQGEAPELLLSSLLDSLNRIQTRLGGLEHQTLKTQLIEAFEKDLCLSNHVEWIQKLLKTYYDPLYSFAMNKHPRNIIFKGDYQSCKTWIQNKFA